MTSNLDTTRASNGDRTRAKRFMTDFLPAMAAYVVILVVVVLFGGLDGNSPARFVWAVLPIIPLAWVIWAMARHLRRIDELQSRQTYQGLSIGFGAAMLAAVTAGFLGIAGLDMRLGGWVIFVVGMLGWAVGQAVLAGRNG
ncbi:hypothetical protein [Antricoccus suffuscus]|nr:hypothetical protein [Antricoccus suffuscus]